MRTERIRVTRVGKYFRGREAARPELSDLRLLSQLHSKSVGINNGEKLKHKIMK